MIPVGVLEEILLLSAIPKPLINKQARLLFSTSKTLTEEIMSITAGIRSRELCQAPISASVILSLAGVVGESLSFSTLQMQMRLGPDWNTRLEATYRHSHLSITRAP